MEINELVKRAKQGNSESFALIYDQFAQRIFRYIRLKIQNKEQAEDILQDVFVKAYTGLRQLNVDNMNFSAWLYKIASNTVNDYFRKKYRTPEIVAIDEKFDAASNVSVEKEAEINSDMERLILAFEQIPPLYREVLELRFIQNFAPDEVAKILGKTNLAVRLVQYRALKKVQSILRK